MAIKLHTKDLYEITEGKHPQWPQGLDRDTQLWAYNGLDSAVTLRVHEALVGVIQGRNDPCAATSYRFVRAMQGPAMAMMLRGVMIQQRVRQDETQRAQAARTRAQAILDRLADAVWGPEEYMEVIKTRELVAPIGKRGVPLKPRLVTKKIEFPATRPRGLNAASPLQMLAFFNIALNFPVEYEIRKTAQGNERTPTANDNTLRKWARRRTKGPGIALRDRTIPPVQVAQPFVSLILQLRDLDKQLGVLRSSLEPDGRMRCSYNVTGTKWGRWCLAGGHEVLTKIGWVRLDEWKGGEIAQWSVDGAVRFLPATPNQFPNDDELIRVDYPSRVSILGTPEHQQPYFTGRGTFKVATLGEGKYLNSVPVGGKLQGEFVNEDQTRASVMMQADGSIVHERLVRFHFKKPRKIARCVEHLTALQIPFKRSEDQEGATYIYVYDPPEWLKEAKFFGPWLLNHNPSVFCDELHHWDGYKPPRFNSVEYSSIREANAEWVQTMGHLDGRFVSRTTRMRGGWSDAYRCRVGVPSTTRIKAEHYRRANSKAATTVYCPSTQTGYFLTRYEGHIIVTGNSSSKNQYGRATNLQNITDTMRRMFCADDGWRLISTDLEQAESRLVAGCVWQATGNREYLDACLSGDLHTRVCMLAWPELGWVDDNPNNPANRAIANRRYPNLGRLTYRDVAKRIGHGSNYRGSAFGISEAVGIPHWIVEEFQQRYFLAFPSIRQWHEWVREQLMTYQHLDTPLLRRNVFFDRPTESSTLREAIAFTPQSTVAELLNLILYRVWRRTLLPSSSPRHLPIQLLLQNHDAFLLQTPMSVGLSWVINEINKEFQHATVPFTRGEERLDLNIPGEFVTGWNWAKADPDRKDFEDGNPDGLRKWNGRDERRRVQRAKVAPSEWLSGPLPRVY